MLCDKSLSNNDYVLEGDNSCILLCDREMQKAISCLFDPESQKGEKAWFDETNRDEEGDPTRYTDAMTQFVCEW